MMKKLLLNIGHMSSSEAIKMTRKIPNKEQEKVMQFRHMKDKKSQELKKLLMEDLVRF